VRPWRSALGGFESAHVQLLDDSDPAMGIMYTFAGGTGGKDRCSLQRPTHTYFLF
jgi:hypothetical protein